MKHRRFAAHGAALALGLLPSCSDDSPSAGHSIAGNGGTASRPDGAVSDASASGAAPSDAALADATSNGGPVDLPLSTVSANGFTFNLRTLGPADGEPVILLHGFPETSYEWRYQMVALARAGYRTIAPDQRGYSPGARPSVVSDYAVVDLVADVLAIAAALGVDRFHVVGHDWGAAVAWGIAAIAPGRVRSLTSMSVPHPAPLAAQIADPKSCQHQASAYFKLFAADASDVSFLSNDAGFLRATYGEATPDARAEYLRVLDSEPAINAALNWYRANTSTSGELAAPPVRAITVPTLLIWGDKDQFFCRDTIELTKDYVSAPYELEILAGVDHWVPELAATRVNELLLAHLRAGDGG